MRHDNIMLLLTRDEFEQRVFKRDKYTCIFCEKKAVDAHHIMDRKLWENGGYYLLNGASVCADHHWECEITKISTHEVRQAAGIMTVMYPPGFDPLKMYDKWGNEITSLGMIKPGPLFEDTGCYRALKLGKKLGFVDHS